MVDYHVPPGKIRETCLFCFGRGSTEKWVEEEPYRPMPYMTCLASTHVVLRYAGYGQLSTTVGWQQFTTH
jgi:hypothetical protein